MRILAVMAHQRSGSHFLGAAIGSHPAMKYTGEIFNGKKRPASSKAMWAGIDRVRGGRPDVLCLDTKYNQISRPVEELLAQDDVKVVHLVRRNLLRLYFSGELHDWRGEHPGDRRVPTLRFSNARFNAIVQEIEEYKRRFEHLADLTLYYEDLTGDYPTHQLPDWASQKICELVQVNVMPLTIGTEKEAPRDLFRYLTGVPRRIAENWQ